MSYSLGTSSEPNATWGAYYNALGEIQEERPKKTGDLEASPLVGLDSSDTDVFDNGGCVLETTLRIKKIVASFTDAGTFIRALLTLINGDQLPPHYPITYVSDILGTIKVKVKKIDAPVIVGDGPCSVFYTLTLIESSEFG